MRASFGDRGLRRRGWRVLGIGVLIAGLSPSSVRGAAPVAWVTVSTGLDYALTRIDTATYQAAPPIPLPGYFFDLAGLPDGSKVYVVDPTPVSGKVAVVSAASGSVITTIPLTLPSGITVSPDGSRAYVTARPNVSTDYALYTIDTATDSLIGAPVLFPGSHDARTIVVHPDGSRAYVSDHAAGLVFEVRTTDHAVRVLALPPPLRIPHGLAISPDGAVLYAASNNSGAEGLVAIDTATWTILGNVQLRFNSYPVTIAVRPDGQRAYVTLYDTFESSLGLAVIDTSTLQLIGQIDVGRNPNSVAMTPDGTRVFVQVQGSNEVVVIDTATNAIVTTIPVGGTPMESSGQFIVGQCTGSCGDGCLRAGIEQCDDGNTTSGDCCSSTCGREPGCCGDGDLDAGEQCDDGNVDANDGCSPSCEFESGCGNGVTEAGEQCDDGNTSNGDCCSSGCLMEPACCGNTTTDPGEQCDDGNPWSFDCCSSACQVEVRSCFTGRLCEAGTCDASGSCAATLVPNCCGNELVEAGEGCDDGDFDFGDDCKPDCTPNVCGDGVVRTGIEQCDGGGAPSGSGCEPGCTITPRAVSSVVGAFVGFSTDPLGQGATSAQPVQVAVVSPLAGTVSMTVTGNPPALPSGYAFVGTQVDIAAPPTGNPASPLDFVFTLDFGVVPFGQNAQTVQIFRNGVLVPECAAGELGGAAPDPCVARRTALPGGDLQLRVFTTAASAWSMGIAPCGDGVLVGDEQCDDGTGNGTDGCCSSTCTTVDADHDGTCDRDDPCSGFARIDTSKLTITGLSTPTADDGLSFAGTVQLPHPFDPPLDPTTDGFVLTLSDRDEAAIAAITIPGGAYDRVTKVGWTAAKSGGSWTYTSKAASPVGGIVKAKFMDRSKKAPGQVKFVVKGKRGAYGFDTTKVPVRAELVLDAPIATTGQCASARYLAPAGQCTVAKGTLKCSAR